MIRHCNGSDPNLKDDAGNVGNCGRTFDDVNHWTTCPHAEFPINPAAQAMLQRAAGDADMSVPELLAAVTDAGPGWHRHSDGTVHADAAPGVDQGDGDPVVTVVDPGSDEARMLHASRRYDAAAHAVMTGIGYLAAKRPALYDDKQLRLGIDTMKVEQSALAKLLIDRGVFTMPEYYEAMADAMELEVQRSEQELSRLFYGRTIKLH